MRTFSVVFFALFLFTACNPSSKKAYVVEGFATDSAFIFYYNNNPVYIVDYCTEKYIDSAMFVDGKFKFNGLVDSAKICRIDIGGVGYDFILEGGNIKISLLNLYSVDGTTLNNGLSVYILGLNAINSGWQNDYMDIRMKTDLTMDKEEQGRLLEKKYNLYQDKFEVFTDSIFTTNNNNILGAYVLWKWATRLSPEKFDSLYNSAGNIVQSNILVQRAFNGEKFKQKSRLK